jgi:hypothetical protein
VKINKIPNHSLAIEARAKKIRPYTESLKFLEHFEVCLTKFRHQQILPNKINSSYSSYLLGEIYPFGLAFVGRETEINR